MNREKVERDSDGNITKMDRYDAKGKLIFTHVSDWKDGRIIRKTSYDSSGNMTASFPYIFQNYITSMKSKFSLVMVLKTY